MSPEIRLVKRRKNNGDRNPGPGTGVSSDIRNSGYDIGQTLIPRMTSLDADGGKVTVASSAKGRIEDRSSIQPSIFSSSPKLLVA